MNLIKIFSAAIMLIFLVVPLSGCIDYANNSKIANPAAVYCRDQGYEYKIRTDESESQYGVCIFEEGRVCDAWEYYRGECGDESPSEDSSGISTAVNKARKYAISMDEYVNENGRDLVVTDTAVMRCPGCFQIEMKYDVDSAKGTDKDVVTVKVTLANREITDTVTSRGSLNELTPQECTASGGRTVNIVGGDGCYPNETKAGEVVGFISPNICCVPKEKDTSKITDFDSCAAAGNPVMESYPRKCSTPEGRTFTENVTGNEGAFCESDSECILPMEYAIMSRCPYEARCVDNVCEVVCPFDERVYCAREQRNAQACTMEYRPVCGYFGRDIQCVKAPCANKFSNPCMACSDENVEYWIEGECPEG